MRVTVNDSYFIPLYPASQTELLQMNTVKTRKWKIFAETVVPNASKPAPSHVCL